MTCALVMIVLALSTSGMASDTTLAVPAPDQGVIRMTYGAPRMNVVPGFRRTEVRQGAGPVAAVDGIPIRADGLDPQILERLERLINRRFDRLEALTGVSGRSTGAFIQFLDTPQGPALLIQPEDRIDAAPDTLYLAEDVTAEQVALLTAPPIPGRPAVAEMPAARISQPGAPITIDRRALQEELFPMVRLNFEFGRASLLGYVDPTLDALGLVLQDHPDLRIEIGGHTDNVGSAAFNLNLSQERAEAVREYLLERFEIEPDRLVARGYGLTRPLTRNRTETERAVNRRVEFTVLGMDEATDEPAQEVEEEELRESIREAVQEAIRESLRTRDAREVEW